MKRRTQKIAIYFALSLTSVFLLTACGKEAEQGTTKAEATTQIMEEDTQQKDTMEQSTEQQSVEPIFGEFQSETLDGEKVNQDIFSKADLTMVNIWGTFCGPCIREMPDLGILNKEYADQGFQIVGIISDVYEAKDETAQEIIDSTGADYTHIILSDDLLNGIVGQTQAVPTTIFVDKDGNQVGNVYAGAKTKEDWNNIIQQLLEEVKK